MMRCIKGYFAVCERHYCIRIPYLAPDWLGILGMNGYELSYCGRDKTVMLQYGLIWPVWSEGTN